MVVPDWHLRKPAAGQPAATNMRKHHSHLAAALRVCGSQACSSRVISAECPLIEIRRGCLCYVAAITAHHDKRHAMANTQIENPALDDQPTGLSSKNEDKNKDQYDGSDAYIHLVLLL